MLHQLARLVLTEQIYCACTINNGMKYHNTETASQTDNANVLSGLAVFMPYK